MKTYPNKLLKAITFSFDDATQQDIRLANLFNKYNLKCTFNVNSGIATHNYRYIYNNVEIYRLEKEELIEAYIGHEIASHSLTHPHLFDLNLNQIQNEIESDISNLNLWFTHQKIIGFAYPYGQVNNDIINILKNNGIKWARNAGHSNSFDIGNNLLNYTPTCHFLSKDLPKLIDDFISLNPDKKQILFIWGHSNELDTNNCWEYFENILKTLANKKDIYYCTNSEALL